VTYPDNSSYLFEYNNNDGRITYTNDGEGGLWQFNRSKSYDGMVISTIATPNTSKTVESIIYSDGGVGKRVTDPSGESTSTYTVSDGLDTYSQSTCGPMKNRDTPRILCQ
jgi:hypothetical protein